MLYKKNQKVFEKSTGLQVTIIKEGLNGKYWCSIGSQGKYLAEKELRNWNISVPKVLPLSSEKGNFVKNQYVIKTFEGKFFQSYEDIIAFVPINLSAPIILDEKNWNISETTAKHREIFLGEDQETTEKKIAKGVHTLGDLN